MIIRWRRDGEGDGGIEEEREKARECRIKEKDCDEHRKAGKAKERD